MPAFSPSDSAVRRLPKIAGGLFVVAALSQANLQVFGRDEALQRGAASDRFLVTRIDRPARGTIEGADGRVLAGNEEASEFGLLLNDVPNSPAFFADLAAASGIPATELMRIKRSEAKRVFWRDPLSRSEAKAVLAVKSKWRADGVSVGSSGKRSYPLGEAAAGFIGFLRDGKPAAGLELGADGALAGVEGKTVGLVDRKGAYLPMHIDPSSVERRDGKNVSLTIDSELQLAAFAAIRNAVESNDADQGAAVVLDPKTGDVLAMANWPSLDPTRIGEPTPKGSRVSDFNANYMAALEPGSTFKILTLALALDRGVVTPGTTVACGGALQVWAGRSVRCDAHGGHRAHGTIEPLVAIAKSCNVSAATWALKVGYEEYVKFLDDSGLMSKTHLGLPLEASGHFNRKEYAKRLQLATFGFGQSMTCTPVGLASAFSMLANGGVRMEPRLIRSIGDDVKPTRAAGRLVSPETAAKLMDYMEAVVETNIGTGKTLRIPGYRLAGKTGTAQKINPKTGTVDGGGYVSNFVGFVPAQNPRAVILVMVDNPKGPRYYGASVAGPAFVEIARATIARLKIEPNASDDRRPGASQSATGAVAAPGAFGGIASALRPFRTSDPPNPRDSEPKKWTTPSVSVETRVPNRQVKP